MNISLIFENFTLLAYEKKQGLPFAMINLHLMKVGVVRDEKKNMEIRITARGLNGSYFENENNINLVEKKMLGALDRVDTFPIEGVSTEQIVEQILEETGKYAREISDLHSSMGTSRDQLIVTIQMLPTGDKVITVTINELKVYLITSIYLHLLEFITMDASVYPEPPVKDTAALKPSYRRLQNR